MPKYSLEFILCVGDIANETIENSIREFGEGLQISECPEDNVKDKNLKIQISADDPTIIFDTCAQFGRIKSVKVHEEKMGKIQNPNTTDTIK